MLLHNVHAQRMGMLTAKRITQNLINLLKHYIKYYKLQCCRKCNRQFVCLGKRTILIAVYDY